MLYSSVTVWRSTKRRLCANRVSKPILYFLCCESVDVLIHFPLGSVAFHTESEPKCISTNQVDTLTQWSDVSGARARRSWRRSWRRSSGFIQCILQLMISLICTPVRKAHVATGVHLRVGSGGGQIICVYGCFGPHPSTIAMFRFSKTNQTKGEKQTD